MNIDRKHIFKVILTGLIIGISFRLIAFYITLPISSEYLYNTPFTIVNLLMGGLVGVAFATLFYQYKELKNNNELLSVCASTDDMTGLYNRRTGLSFLEEQLKLLQEKDIKLSVFFIDINNLKIVNDMYGHKEGDELIIIVGNILKESLRRDDFVCRIGGDEFLVVLPYCSLNQSEIVWNRICENINQYNSKKIKPYNLSLSHGAHECKKGETMEEILSFADKKMYEEKNKYRNLSLT
ncbi:GGDEF domain-containing protein [Alkalithermobacter paradoxus]|uniref:Putative diguanylate cyclase AdrA n=1 Tax=Alkalithermobacter paradoxus TaxID=29349 RepID=A0A1V4I5Y4_9FIRM|nr:putative diguanylate cyclase AdrA [[Clostridium] thermoalcaliphilum]